MRQQQLVERYFLKIVSPMMRLIVLTLMLCISSFSAKAAPNETNQDQTIDRIQLVTQQLNLLKNRVNQAQQELADLQAQHDKELTQFTLDKVSKNKLEKAALNISLSTSNLDSITIELTDSQQSISWLEKNIQEIENQLNVLNIFGMSVAKNQIINTNTKELRADLNYQQKLLVLEKNRAQSLQTLQSIASNILQLKKDDYNRLSALLKSHRLLDMKQQQVQDELAYQQQQNFWLTQLSMLNAKLATISRAKSKEQYLAIEREIFFANENANLAYMQSLIARYKDQIEQMKLAVVKSNSISLLNEIGNQVQTLGKQINRLDGVLKSRIIMLDKQTAYLTQNNKISSNQKPSYLEKITVLQKQYQTADDALTTINKNLAEFRLTLDQALQVELSARQGFPSFGMKTLFDLGKEILFIPALTFQVVKNLSNQIIEAFKSAGIVVWLIFALAQAMFVAAYFYLYRLVARLLQRPLWRGQLNSEYLSLKWLKCHFIDLAVIANGTGVLLLFNVPLRDFIFIYKLSLVWIIFKSIITVAKTSLVESAQNTNGRDIKLYHRLKWIIFVGAVITALTVFVHQLPLIYEIKALCVRLFLLWIMIVSFFLLRSADVVPNLILAKIESQHPYLQKSIRLIGVLIPLLMFSNSVIGLFGFLNLIMTVSWYEGIFLLVLIGYLILRGLLSDGMEQLSRLMIQYVNNGWLWTEAFLKPIHKVLRVTLFLAAWIVLFLLYGWDKQSPIVERLTRLLHYRLASVLNTVITPLNIIELFIVISVFYWTAKWTREFVFRMLLKRTKDMGIRTSIAILSQYSVVVLGMFICLQVLGIDMTALTAVAAMFAFGIGLGLRDLANNFACGFLILLERPLRVGDIVNINGIEGEVSHIGGRAVTVRTWDHMELVVPNTEIFNKAFTNWTAKDNIVRTVLPLKISRYDNPHAVKVIIQRVLSEHKDVLKDPVPEVYLKLINDTLMEFEVRYMVNIRQVQSRTGVMSSVLMSIWDAFNAHGIKPPYPQHEVFLKSEVPGLNLLKEVDV